MTDTSLATHKRIIIGLGWLCMTAFYQGWGWPGAVAAVAMMMFALWFTEDVR